MLELHPVGGEGGLSKQGASPRSHPLTQRSDTRKARNSDLYKGPKKLMRGSLTKIKKMTPGGLGDTMPYWSLSHHHHYMLASLILIN